jgi:hypothetical protein
MPLVERNVGRGAQQPSAARQQMQRQAEARERQMKRERAERLWVWARLALVIVLCGALVAWPYAADCGVGLASYMGAEGTIVLGGLWVASCTWRQRMAGLHALSLVVSLWGLMLVGHQVLVRTGYADIDPANPPRWSCTG